MARRRGNMVKQDFGSQVSFVPSPRRFPVVFLWRYLGFRCVSVLSTLFLITSLKSVSITCALFVRRVPGPFYGVSRHTLLSAPFWDIWQDLGFGLTLHADHVQWFLCSGDGFLCRWRSKRQAITVKTKRTLQARHVPVRSHHARDVMPCYQSHPTSLIGRSGNEPWLPTSMSVTRDICASSHSLSLFLFYVWLQVLPVHV